MQTLAEFIESFDYSNDEIIAMYGYKVVPNHPLIHMFTNAAKYPDVPLINQNELESIFTAESIDFVSDKFPSDTNHCSFNQLLRSGCSYNNKPKGNRIVHDYAMVGMCIWMAYKEYVDLNDPAIQAEKDLAKLERSEDKLLLDSLRA